MRLAWSLTLVLGLLAVSLESRAQAHAPTPPDFELAWSAPNNCPDRARVEAQVAKLAPNPAARERPLRVDGVVRQEADAFVLELVLRDGEFEGRRRFKSDSCAEVVGAAAVTIALLLSSGSAEAAVEAGDAGTAAPRDGQTGAASGADSAPPRGADSRTNQASGRAPAAPRESRSSSTERAVGSQAPALERRWHWVLAAPTLSAGFGILPDASVGLGGGFGIEFDSWRVLLGGVWNFDLRVRLPDASDQGAEVSRGIARLSACHWFGSNRWQFAPCANIALAILVAHGVGSGVATEQADSAWLALGPGVLAGLRLTEWVRMAATVGLELQTARPVLVIDGIGEVEQIGALELSTLVGAEWIF